MLFAAPPNSKKTSIYIPADTLYYVLWWLWKFPSAFGMPIIPQNIKFKSHNMLNISNVSRWWLYNMYRKNCPYLPNAKSLVNKSNC